MPELPEVTALAAYLDERLKGATIEQALFPAIHALKTADPPYTSLVGRRVEFVGRRGKFVVINTSPGGDADEPKDDDEARISVVVHLALGGWMRISDQLPAPTPVRGKGYVAARFGFVRGEETTGIDLT
ncbi:DNA-formamidopyrimidine glycosylase family protein, partial [Sinomonas sp.]|uniref:DNA-formamidopyrimidine glycosylase family protein n=1 Tax=Sinomonas sp. TaxID=1914986 RepID=UPI003F7E10A8